MKQKIILFIALIALFLTISANAGNINIDENDISGNIWRKYSNTVVLSNISDNVMLGKNSTTSYKLNVVGNTCLDGFLSLKNNVTIPLLKKLQFGSTMSLLKIYTDTNVAFIEGMNILNISAYNQLNLNFPDEINLKSDLVILDKDQIVNNKLTTEKLTVNDKSFFNNITTFNDSVVFNNKVYFNSAIYYNNSQVAFMETGSIIACNKKNTDFDIYGYLINDSIWHICNGKNGTLNLTNMFIMCANVSNQNTTGGTNNYTLTDNNMYHRHLLNEFIGTKTISTGLSGTASVQYNDGITQPYTKYLGTQKTGFDNRPSYRALFYIEFVGY